MLLELAYGPEFREPVRAGRAPCILLRVEEAKRRPHPRHLPTNNAVLRTGARFEKNVPNRKEDSVLKSDAAKLPPDLRRSLATSR